MPAPCCGPILEGHCWRPRSTTTMPPTPDEALAKNKGKANQQLEKAIQELADDIEAALEDYTGEHIYVGLPAYLHYLAEADRETNAGLVTLRMVDLKLHERFGSFGWKIGIVINSSNSQCWAKIMDAREI